MWRGKGSAWKEVLGWAGGWYKGDGKRQGVTEGKSQKEKHGLSMEGGKKTAQSSEAWEALPTPVLSKEGWHTEDHSSLASPCIS